MGQRFIHGFRRESLALEELERIPGVGPKLVEKYGRPLIGIVDDDDGA